MTSTDDGKDWVDSGEVCGYEGICAGFRRQLVWINMLLEHRYPGRRGRIRISSSGWNLFVPSSRAVVARWVVSTSAGLFSVGDLQVTLDALNPSIRGGLAEKGMDHFVFGFSRK